MTWRERPHRLVVGVRGSLGAAPGVEAEDEVADVDLVPFVTNRRLRDLPTVYVGAVRTFEIRDDKTAIAKEQASVVLGDVALREHQVVPLNAPDVDLVFVERLFSAALLSLMMIENIFSVVPRERQKVHVRARIDTYAAPA